MKDLDIEAECQLLKSKGMKIMNIIGYGNLNDDEIIKFEKQIGFTLPLDYRIFLKNNNGGVPEKKYSTFKLNKLNIDVGLQVLYGLNLNDNLNLRVWHEEYKEDMLNDCIIIGHGVGFGFVLLINDEENGGVYFWDHSFELENTSEEENIYKISNSFEEFINSLNYHESD